jgi:chaperonin GroEL (HSP60 family)
VFVFVVNTIVPVLLQVIPRQLCDNAGFDATDMLNKLRQKHALSDGSGKVCAFLPLAQTHVDSLPVGAQGASLSRPLTSAAAAAVSLLSCPHTTVLWR